MDHETGQTWSWIFVDCTSPSCTPQNFHTILRFLLLIDSKSTIEPLSKSLSPSQRSWSIVQQLSYVNGHNNLQRPPPKALKIVLFNNAISLLSIQHPKGVKIITAFRSGTIHLWLSNLRPVFITDLTRFSLSLPLALQEPTSPCKWLFSSGDSCLLFIAELWSEKGPSDILKKPCSSHDRATAIQKPVLSAMHGTVGYSPVMQMMRLKMLL